ncbi:MAG TPA: Rrf2 family transcriptional regulator [Longimicrobium sp.]|nr:Rrf2 family transcriptional regulator [Longimicrobium sp.]
MNSRFAVAVHILTLLQQSGGEPLTSEYVAGSVNTNASLIRRILSALARARLTTSRLGAGGGALLARPAAEITLLDVYRAVDDGELFGMHREVPNPNCPVGRNIQLELECRFERAARALEAELSRTTIAEMALGITRRDADGEAPAGAG